MKKSLCALLILLLLGACALAEPGDFRAGADAAYLSGELFFAVSEGATRALVKVDSEGKRLIADRAEDIGPAVTLDGALYYLRKEGGAWALVRRGGAGEKGVAYAFAAGEEARALGAYGGDLFALVNGQLHVLYPRRGLCLKLADARMSEYAIAADYAYFVSLADIVSYELPTPAGGVAAGESGCLYKLNLSTGNTTLVMKAGAKNLKYAAGKLYFHNLSDGYLSAAGDRTWVEGRLYSFDLASETPARLLDDYDWDYFPAEPGLIVYRAGEVSLVGAPQPICAPGPRAVVAFADARVLVYDPDAQSFAAYEVTGEE